MIDIRQWLLKGRYFLTLLILLSSVSCSQKASEQSDWDKNNLRSIELGDPQVMNAMKAAQDSLPFYIDYFKKHFGEENYDFFLKSSFTDNDNTEHMWSNAFALESNGFRCTLDNVPDELTNYELGDTITIDFRKIEDFIIITGDTTIIGNYLDKEIDN